MTYEFVSDLFAELLSMASANKNQKTERSTATSTAPKRYTRLATAIMEERSLLSFAETKVAAASAFLASEKYTASPNPKAPMPKTPTSSNNPAKYSNFLLVSSPQNTRSVSRIIPTAAAIRDQAYTQM